MARNLWARIQKLALALALCALPSYALADDESEKFEDLIHADLPLFGDETTNKWPQHFSDTDGFGCASRVDFGDWALLKYEDGDEEIEHWYRIWNYGVFHCFAIVAEAYERENLENAGGKHSFFVELEKSDDLELWTLQMGGRPGSDYLLLSRKPTDGTVSKFTVLQRKCPKRNVRDAGAIDILKTEYCAINSKSEMRDFARRMSRLVPLGELVFVEPSQALENESDQPE